MRPYIYINSQKLSNWGLYKESLDLLHIWPNIEVFWLLNPSHRITTKDERKSNRHNTGTMAHVNKFLLKLKPKGHGKYETQKFHNYMCKMKKKWNIKKRVFLSINVAAAQ